MKRAATVWLIAGAMGVLVLGAWAASELECAGLAEPQAAPAAPGPVPPLSLPTESELDLAPGAWPAITF
jgi:hypothetical protein